MERRKCCKNCIQFVECKSIFYDGWCRYHKIRKHVNRRYGDECDNFFAAPTEEDKREIVRKFRIYCSSGDAQIVFEKEPAFGHNCEDCSHCHYEGCTPFCAITGAMIPWSGQQPCEAWECWDFPFTTWESGEWKYGEMPEGYETDMEDAKRRFSWAMTKGGAK